MRERAVTSLYVGGISDAYAFRFTRIRLKFSCRSQMGHIAYYRKDSLRNRSG
jgi:hypothetical protein